MSSSEEIELLLAYFALLLNRIRDPLLCWQVEAVIGVSVSLAECQDISCVGETFRGHRLTADLSVQLDLGLTQQ